jgi:hypothetical protein
VTGLSWRVGIVALDSDLALTMITVIAHGVPYFALIWWTARRSGEHAARTATSRLFTAT